MTYTGDGNELWITTARDVKRFGFNIETHDLIAPTDPKGFRTIAVSRDGAWQAGSAEDGHLAIWDAREGVLRAKHPTLMAEAGSIAVFSNGPTVYWCGGPTSVGHIWNVSEGTTRTIGGGLNGLPDLSPSCDRMAVYHWDTTMVWDITVDPPVLVWENHGWGPEFRTLFSPGGDLVAVPSFSSQLRLIATDTGEVVRTLKGHTDMVTSVQFSNDGSWLVSGGVDRAVRIWDVETGQLLSTFFNPDGPVWAVALSPNEDSIASLTDAGLVRLWTIATPEEVDQYEKH